MPELTESDADHSMPASTGSARPKLAFGLAAPSKNAIAASPPTAMTCTKSTSTFHSKNDDCGNVITGYVYLIHFLTPMYHAQHYLGWSPTPQHRVPQHGTDQGSRICQAATEQGNQLVWAACYKVRHGLSGREIERQIKNHGRLKHHCPICNPETYVAPIGTTEIPVPQVPQATESHE